jgi:TPP-dependent pyruvate/acetoin dehydrogenase alpha subunit
LLWRRCAEETAASEGEREDLQNEVERRLDRAIEWAKGRDHPLPEAGAEDVYAEPLGGAALQ